MTPYNPIKTSANGDWQEYLRTHRTVDDAEDAGGIDLFGDSNDLEQYASTMTLLIIDDDAPLQRQIHDTFSAYFLNTQCAKNGKEALDIARQMRSNRGQTIGPDIIILDLDMPIMDGIAFAEKWRHENPVQSYVIFTSYKGGQGRFFQRLTGGVVGMANHLIPGRTVNKSVDHGGGEFALQNALINVTRSLHSLQGWKDLGKSR